MVNADGEIGFTNYIISDIVFELNSDWDSAKDIELNNQNFKIYRNAVVDKKEAQLSMIVELFEKSEKYPFHLTFVIHGFFTNNSALDDEFKSLVINNGAVILFPYIRTTVSDITKLCNGIMPLINLSLI